MSPKRFYVARPRVAGTAGVRLVNASHPSQVAHHLAAAWEIGIPTQTELYELAAAGVKPEEIGQAEAQSTTETVAD